MIGRHTGILAVIAAAALLSGCGRNRAARVDVPPAPPVQEAPASPPPETPPPAAQPSPEPVYVETGLASWYGPPYHNRRGANGEVYDMNALTAAHKILPLNSLVRVTNLKTGSSTVVRITDRGPFVGDRIIDLSLAAALYLGVVHLADGAEGARSRIALAGEVVPRFGLATDCGWGRRPAETVQNLLDLHARILEPRGAQ